MMKQAKDNWLNERFEIINSEYQKVIAKHLLTLKAKKINKTTAALDKRHRRTQIGLY